MLVAWKFVSLPTLLVAIGSLLVLAGAFLSSLEQSAFQQQIANKNEEITKLNKKVANMITGGDSFCYASINRTSNPNNISTVILHSGEYPLYDVNARVVDLDNPVDWATLKQVPGEMIQLGNIPPGTAGSFFDIPIKNRTTIKINIFFNGRNGFFSQELRFVKINKEWKSATRVSKYGASKEDNKLLFEEIDPSLLKNGPFNFK